MCFSFLVPLEILSGRYKWSFCLVKRKKKSFYTLLKVKQKVAMMFFNKEKGE